MYELLFQMQACIVFSVSTKKIKFEIVQTHHILDEIALKMCLFILNENKSYIGY